MHASVKIHGCVKMHMHHKVTELPRTSSITNRANFLLSLSLRRMNLSVLVQEPHSQQKHIFGVCTSHVDGLHVAHVGVQL